MEKRLHAAGGRSGKRRTFTSARQQAGVPLKRFFTRFSSLSDVPASDLDYLAERIRLALVIGPGSDTARLYAAVREEMRSRESALDE
jgi:hypothetical protein